jgi:2'-5' RNA ligase
MTLAYLGACDASRLEQAKKQLTNIANQVLPLVVTFGKDDMFGPKNDIPVRLCILPDVAREKLGEFYKQFAVPEPGLTASHAEQVFHVSKRGAADLDQANGFIGHVIFIKQLGPHDPIFEVSTHT